MEYGIEVDELVTIEMIQKGHWLPGTLLDLTGQMFMVIGYNYWGWIEDCDDENVYYDVVLYHIETGWYIDFPLATVLSYSKVLGEDDEKG
tara:strand:- start:1045 stop:1314 length:270 start_codon:yes stop_codon:yes gene_type:complete